MTVPTEPGEYCVEVSLRSRSGTRWAPAGHEVAWQQQVFTVAGEPAAVTGPAPELVRGIHNYGVRGEGFLALFSRLHGGLVSYRYGPDPDDGRELLTGMPMPNFWHAPTSNERGWGMPFRDGQWRSASLDAKPADAGPGGATARRLGRARSTATCCRPPRRASARWPIGCTATAGWR
ncbi:MAG: DUF4981 domain-containing protein [Propionicimonas sp.]